MKRPRVAVPLASLIQPARAGLWMTMLIVTAGGLAGCGDGDQRGRGDAPAESRLGVTTLSPEVKADVVAFCGDCHPLPDPTSFPRDAWHEEVRRGYDFYYASGRTDLTVPVQTYTHQYFASRAPERLQLPAADPIDPEWASRFRQHDITIPGLEAAAVSYVAVVDLGNPLGRGIAFSDMRGGGVYFTPLSPEGDIGTPRRIGQAENPAVIRVCDWDQDGHLDLLVADLGSFLPEDHDRGRVLWFHQLEESPGEFQRQTLHDRIGRVASIEVADFDDDGLDDLLVAEFGWQKTGSIFWLQRDASGDPLDGWIKHSIDDRSGAIHVPVVDFNGDGSSDFVALISQHHERIEAMINDGTGGFHKELIYAAPGPSFGSSGIELVDLTGNGRLDVLYTNGDSFDSFVLKPSHGVRWLENQGTFPFRAHELGPLPGAHRAVTGDLDGDGQREIVAGAFIPQDLMRAQRQGGAEALVVWKREGNGRYRKHVLSRGDGLHATLSADDVNGNGRDDLVIGHFRESGAAAGPAITVWMTR